MNSLRPYLSVAFAIAFLLSVALPGCKTQEPAATQESTADSQMSDPAYSQSPTKDTSRATSEQPQNSVESTQTNTQPETSQQATADAQQPSSPTQSDVQTPSAPVQPTVEPANTVVTESSQATEPPQVTEATDASIATEPTEGRLLTYEEFSGLSGEEKQAYKNSFDTVKDYMNWFNDAFQAYQEENTIHPSQDGSIDLGDLVDGST